MGSLTLKVGANISEMEAALDKAEKKIRRTAQVARQESEGSGGKLFEELGKNVANPAEMLKGIGSVVGGGVAVGAVVELAAQAKEVAHGFREMQEQAEKVGETVENFERVKEVARQCNVSVDSVVSGFVKLEKNLADVDKDKAFEHLGVSAEKLAGMPLEQKILTLSEAFQKAREEGVGMNALLELCGKSSADMIPMLSKSKEELEAMFAQKPDFSGQFVNEMAQCDKEIQDFEKLLSDTFKRVVGSILGIGHFIKDLFKNIALGRGLEGALNDMGAREQARQEKENQDVRAKSAQAAGVAKLRAEKEAHDAAKKAHEAQEKEDERHLAALKRMGAVQERMAKDKLASLPEGERMKEMEFQRANLMMGRSEKQMMAQVKALEKDKRDEEAENVLHSLEKAVELTKEMDALQKSMRDRDAAEAEKQYNDIQKLRESTRHNEDDMLPAARRLEGLKKEIQQIFKDAGSKEMSFDALKKQADEAKRKGDHVGEKRALESLEKVQHLTSEAAKITPGQGGINGAFAKANNLLMGHSVNEMVLQENKAQTNLFGQAVAILREINANSKKTAPPAVGAPVQSEPRFSDSVGR